MTPVCSAIPPFRRRLNAYRHVVKVRFQSPQIASKYLSTLHAFLTIVREERIRGLYRGIAAPLVRLLILGDKCYELGFLTPFFTSVVAVIVVHKAGALPLNGLVFSSYRSLLRVQLDDERATPTLTQINLAGAGTGIICSYASRCLHAFCTLTYL